MVIKNVPKAIEKAKQVLKGKARYEAVAKLVNIPWYMVGVIHLMEASGKWNTHLHNGDPLSSRTKHVPAGLPKTGKPPFTWEESALDALKYDRMKNLDTLEKQLSKLERYNGMGYAKRGINTPYLWASTNHYTKGRFVADRKFDPEAVSQRIGAAVVIKILEELGEIKVV